MGYILTRKSVKPSAKKLAQALGLFVRTELHPTIPPIIRWGNSDGSIETGINIGKDTTLNSAVCIGYSGNKRLFSEAMKDDGITHVEINKGKPEKYPVVVRTILSGSKGAGIVLCENEEQFKPYQNYYWSYWYNFSFELGVHILGGKIARVFKKTWNVEDTTATEPKYPIRNLDKGYGFRLVLPETVEAKYGKLKECVSKFYEVFPIEMGRLDIGWDSDNKCYRIIEMNSAPGLTENDTTLKMYVDFLKEKLGETK